MAESKAFKLRPPVTAEMLAKGVQAFFMERKGMTAETLSTPDGYLVQAKTKEDWKKYAGMGNAMKVAVKPMTEEMVIVEMGEGKWSDKAGAAAAGAILFAPLAVTAIVGALGQKNLPKEIYEFIETFIASGGTSISLASTGGNAGTNPDGQVICPACKSFNPPNNKFCLKCGEKLKVDCPKCGNALPLGSAFCPECGEKLETKPTCPRCNADISPGQRFCPDCGTPIQS